MSDLHVDSADGTLVVIVVRAKHLPNRRKFDKQLPYATLRIGTVARKTPSHFRAGQTPDWTHEVRFDLLAERKPLLIIDVLDETKNDPTMIGHGEIDCLEVFKPENEQDGKFILDNWYELKFNEKRAGLIYLEMTFYPLSPMLPPKVPLLASHHKLLASHHKLVSYNQLYGHEQITDEYHDDDDYDNEYEPNTSNALRPLLEFGLRHMLLQKLLPIRKKEPLPPPLPQHSISKPLSSSSPSRSHYRSSSPQLSPRPSHSPQRGCESPSRDYYPSRTNHSPDIHHHSPRPKLLLPKKVSVDDVFVLASYKTPGFLKKLKKFAALLNFGNYPVVTPGTAAQGDDKKGIKGKFSKFILKYEAREPVSVLWKESLGLSSTNSNKLSQDDYFRSSLPISEYESDPIINKDDVPPPPPHLLVLQVPKSSMAPYLPQSELAKNYSKLLIGVPFSADRIGMDDDSRKASVQLNTNQRRAPQHDDDERYYAPRPTEKLNQSYRLQDGQATNADLSIDFRTQRTGYLGNGKFSPSVFDRIHNDMEEEIKPPVPPKIPQGLTEREYYEIDRDLFLRDLNGQRF